MENKQNEFNKKSKIIAIIAISLVVVMMGVLFFIVGKPLVKFASEPEKFKEWVDSFGFSGKLIYMGMVILQIIVAIIPGEPLELVAGYAFGTIEGTILCLIASTIGSMIVFCLVRKFGMKLIRVFFSEEKINSVSFLKSSPKKNILFLIIFMIPGTPKDLLCYFAGITDIKFGVMFLIYSLGRIPAIITSTVGGNALGTENYTFAIIVFAVTLLISAGGILVYNYISKKNREK